MTKVQKTFPFQKNFRENSCYNTHGIFMPYIASFNNLQFSCGQLGTKQQAIFFMPVCFYMYCIIMHSKIIFPYKQTVDGQPKRYLFHNIYQIVFVFSPTGSSFSEIQQSYSVKGICLQSPFF